MFTAKDARQLHEKKNVGESTIGQVVDLIRSSIKRNSEEYAVSLEGFNLSSKDLETLTKSGFWIENGVISWAEDEEVDELLEAAK